MSTQPSKQSLCLDRRYWLDFSVFYLGLLWLPLPAGYFPIGAAYAAVTAVVVAGFLAWAVLRGDRACLRYRVLLGLGALAPILGVVFPAHNDGGDALMIMLMTAAGFVIIAKQTKDRRAARIAASRVPT